MTSWSWKGTQETLLRSTIRQPLGSRHREIGSVGMSDPAGRIDLVDEGDARVCTGCLTTVSADRFPARGRRCLECRRAHMRDHYRRNRAYYVPKARRRNRRVIQENRVLVLAYLCEHPCVDCGNGDVRVLEFDHRDGTSKEAPVAVLARDAFSRERILREIGKCEVRCANCHRIRTHHQLGWWGSLLGTADPPGADDGEGPHP